MKGAVIVEPGKLEIWDDIPMPEMNDYQAMVEQLACGVCTGTDWKLLEGHFKGFDTYPAVLGHEAVGRVVEKGKKVRNFEIGDMVLRPGLETIGDGESLFSGWGAFAEYGVAGDWEAMRDDGKMDEEDGFLDLYYSQQKIPGSMDPNLGTFLITYKEVLSAMYRFGFGANNKVLIFGMGPVGLSFVRFSKVLGLNLVVACDVQKDRLDLAEDMGADICLFSEEVAEWAGVNLPEGFDFIVDAVGIADLINLAMKMIAFNGKICTYGIAPQTSMTLDWEAAPYNWDLQFVQFPTFTEEAATHDQIVSWIDMGILDISKVVSHIMPLDDIMEALNLLRTRNALKVVIDLKA